MTDTEPKMMRTLFCVAVNQNFHDLPLPQAQQLMGVFITALDDLKGRFGMEVLGTFDDDQMMVGASNGAPISWQMCRISMRLSASATCSA